MILAKVCGNVVATHIEPGFHSVPLRFVVKVFDLNDSETVGEPFIAIDRIGVCDGEFVLLETAMESGLGMSRRCGADAAIIAIVDKI
ncbi:MAG: EutN/CcmL family microcompartment protein [bacterium]|nr:EutN/CcmL family microcompartment protein [bacterium]